MGKELIRDKEFNNVDFTKYELIALEYENCSFINCNLYETDLSNLVFIDCSFDNSDLSLAKLTNTAFKSIIFTNCKMLGLHFEDCNPFLISMTFNNCQLNLSCFYQINLTTSAFNNCKLHEVDFNESKLRGNNLKNCDLLGAVFQNTILNKVDFRTSYNFSIDPEINSISGAKFSASGALGLLDKFNIIIE